MLIQETQRGDIMASVFDKLRDSAESLERTAAQVQKNINSRLDGLYFRVLTQEEFEAEETHYGEQITFVTRTVNDELKIDIYKGDIKINLDGGGGGDTIDNTVIVGDLE